MSQFSNQLLASMEQRRLTQTGICEKTGLSQGAVSRYVNGENRPPPEVLEQLCKPFPEDHRIALLLAYLTDDVPMAFRKLITIAPRTGAARSGEEPGVYRARMPQKLRAAYDYLGEAALEKPRVAQSLINTYELLKSGAA